MRPLGPARRALAALPGRLAKASVLTTRPSSRSRTSASVRPATSADRPTWSVSGGAGPLAAGNRRARTACPRVDVPDEFQRRAVRMVRKSGAVLLQGEPIQRDPIERRQRVLERWHVGCVAIFVVAQHNWARRAAERLPERMPGQSSPSARPSPRELAPSIGPSTVRAWRGLPRSRGPDPGGLGGPWPSSGVRSWVEPSRARPDSQRGSRRSSAC